MQVAASFFCCRINGITLSAIGGLGCRVMQGLIFPERVKELSIVAYTVPGIPRSLLASLNSVEILTEGV